MKQEPDPRLQTAPADAAGWTQRPPSGSVRVPDRGPDGFRGPFLRETRARLEFSEASGILATVPAAVAVPFDAADVSALVRWAAETGTPLVPRGAGTGMPGGNVGPGVAVDLVTHFTEIRSVDVAGRTAWVEPGVTLGRLNETVAASGLLFPVDPSSGARCTLGGMAANNSGGSHTVKYGSVRRWVRALDVVLDDGTVARVERGRPPEAPRLREALARAEAAVRPRWPSLAERWPRVRKNSSGYALREWRETGDAVDLLVGSEGTLALVTGVEVMLAPIAPRRGLVLLEFGTLEGAVDAVQRLLPLEPSACEMIDRTFIDLVRSGGEDPGYPLRDGLEALLFVEVEGEDEADVAARLARVMAAVAGVADHAAPATTPELEARYWHVRHAASPLIAKLAGVRRSMQFIEDGVVPVDRLADYVRLLRRVLDAAGLQAVIFGHAGDGNLHVNPLVDTSAEGWRDRVEGVIREVTRGVAALGGTMSGEHGDGRLRAPLLETIWGAEAVAAFRAVKEAFDPRGILNPGVILPLPGQRPLDAVKY